jgi:peptidoglycan lytic transglycosylase
VLLAGCAPTAEHREDLSNQVVAVPQTQAVDPATQARAEQIAKDVEAKAKRTEKAEGKQDLVKDGVQVKTENGHPVVEQVGEASWYGKFHQGRKTANGERFDQKKLTAAHPTLPLGIEAKVTNLETGKSVDVIINDRGPYVKGRDLDLSKAAAQKIGVTEDGTAPVKIEAAVTPAPGLAAEKR